MVARLVRDQEARSSNLRTPTKKRQRDNPPPFFLPSGDRWFAGLSSNQAQLGLGKEALRRRGRMEQSLFFRSRAALRDEALRRSLQTASAARWGEAKRPGVQISALRPKNGRGITLCHFFRPASDRRFGGKQRRIFRRGTTRAASPTGDRENAAPEAPFHLFREPPFPFCAQGVY